MSRLFAPELIRDLARCLLSAWLLLGRPVWADPPQALGDGVFWLQGRHAAGAQPDGNSILLRGPGGWVLVDSGRHAGHTQALLDFMQTPGQGSEPPSVINTHWHLDHLGGNALLREALPGLRSYASGAVDTALNGWLSDYRTELQRLSAQQDLDPVSQASVRIDLALLAQTELLRPDHRLDQPQQDLTLAGRRLRVGTIPGAVSGGDVWVLDLSSRTLVSGDLVTLPVPFLDTACAAAWETALDALGELPFERLVPGHGPVLSREEFQRYRTAYGRLMRCAASDGAWQSCSAQWLQEANAWIPAEEQARAKAMMGYYLQQHLRTPAAERERFCKAKP